MKIREIKRSQKRERGATMVEYALVVGLIAIVAITALQSLGTSVKNAFEYVGNEIQTKVTSSSSGGSGTGGTDTGTEG